MSRRVIRVSEAQSRERIAQLRDEMERVEVPPPPEPPADTPPEDDGRSLEQLVEDELKTQLRQRPVQGYAVVNAIKFLAVKAKLPVQFGTELDQ